MPVPLKLIVLAAAATATILLVPRDAHALKFAVVGAGIYAKPSSNNKSASYKGKFAFGGGALLEFALGKRFALELGGIYRQRKFQESSGDYSATITSSGVEIPFQLKFKIVTALSLGAGPYAVTTVGKLKLVDSTGTYSTSYSDTPIKTLDYGVFGALGINVPIGSWFAILLDARYLFGIANNARKGTFYQNDFEALFGFRFGKEPAK